MTEIIKPEQAKVIRPMDLNTLPQAANAQFARATINGQPSVTLVLFDKDGRPFTQLPYVPVTWAKFTTLLRDELLQAVAPGGSA